MAGEIVFVIDVTADCTEAFNSCPFYSRDRDSVGMSSCYCSLTKMRATSPQTLITKCKLKDHDCIKVVPMFKD